MSAFGSGHDLRVLGWSPTSGFLLGRESLLPLSLLSLSPFLKQINSIILKMQTRILQVWDEVQESTFG